MFKTITRISIPIFIQFGEHFFLFINNIDIDIDMYTMNMIDDDTVEDVDFLSVSQFYHLKMIILFQKCVWDYKKFF